jgi:hypothetical protein
LDTIVASKIVDSTDHIFCTLTQIQPKELQKQIQIVNDKVQPAFMRSGLTFSDEVISDSDGSFRIVDVTSGPQFNYASYVHYKAYTDLWLDKCRNRSFPTFQKSFEEKVGQQVVAILIPLILENDV